jgi:hypothetical protein
MPTNKINALASRLACLDWFYDYSDDHSVWKKGLENYRALIADVKKLSREELDELILIARKFETRYEIKEKMRLELEAITPLN